MAAAALSVAESLTGMGVGMKRSGGLEDQADDDWAAALWFFLLRFCTGSYAAYLCPLLLRQLWNGGRRK